MNKEDFIKKAEAIHGKGTYDYSKLPDEIKMICGSENKITIICPIHGKFEQNPVHHTSGNGCQKCGRSKQKYSNEEFIAKAKLVHGDKYDYSKTDLDNRDEKGKVCIICPEHGEFWQKPRVHLQGQGCRPCGIQRVANILSKQQKGKPNKLALKKKEKSEQELLDVLKGTPYRLVKYISSTNSEGWCTIHQKSIPLNKYRIKKGKCPCEDCAKEQGSVGKSATESLQEIQEKYPDWEIEIPEKFNSKTNLRGYCKKHNKEIPYLTIQDFHREKGGCPLCMGRKVIQLTDNDLKNIIHKNYHGELEFIGRTCYKYIGRIVKWNVERGFFNTQNFREGKVNIYEVVDTATFIAKCKIDLHSQLDYSQTEYKGAYKPITFRCPIHGLITQKASSHLTHGAKCPTCSHGFSRDRILSLLSEKDLLNLEDSCLLAMIKDGTLPPSFNVLAGKYGEERIHAIKALKEEIISKGEDYVEDCADDATTLEIPQINTLKEKEGCITFDDALKSIEAVDKGQTPGKDTAEFFRNKYLGAFWSAFINSQNKDIDLQKLKNKKFSPFFDAIRKEFLKQYEEVVVLRPDKDCTFKYKDTPNLSQQYTVWRMRHNPCFGNWSDTGAGKSFARDWTSRDLKSHCNLYVVPNALVNDTANNLKDAYQDSNIIIVERLDDIKPLDKNQWNYVILNYEKFQLDNSKALVDKLVQVGFDFVCFDEVQNAKIRNEEKKSIRSVNIRNLRIELQKKNPNLKVLALSATPIINNLTEVKNLIELLTGKIQDQIKNTNKLFDILEAHKALVIYGNRFVPQYDININTEKIRIDAPHLRDKLEQVSGEGEFRILEIEQVLLESKMEELMKQGKIKPKTVIYSYYVEDMTEKIKSYISQLNMSVVGYTGQEDKKEREAKLAAFKRGNIDVLVGSAPIGTGVDGLQEVCDNMIIITPPWTNAEYHQLIGRIYRQGSKFKDVNVVIPMVYVGNYSWDEWRWNIIEYKRALGEAVMSGKFAYSDPEKARKELLIKATETLRNGIYNSNSAEDKQIAIQKEEVEIRKRCEGEVNKIHRIANTSNHENLKQTCYGGSLDKFIEYHQHRQKAMEDWGEDPVDHVKEIIDKFNDCSKVLDMGCGLNKLKAIMPDKEVTGVDLYSNLKDVIQADMADLSQVVSDMSYNICVFCLSLWGKNYEDYFKEAYRILKRNGFLIIVEPKDKLKDGEHFNSQNAFINKVEEANFMQLGKAEERGKFVYFQFFKQ